jgi:gamma-glutamyl-gamma-aminobutyrate hydrolase PuuD
MQLKPATKSLLPQLHAAAVAKDLVEAAYMPGKSLIWGVQWHPALSVASGATKKLFRAFAAACGKNHFREEKSA